MKNVTTIPLSSIIELGFSIPLRFRHCFRCAAETVYLDIGTNKDARPFPEADSNRFCQDIFAGVGGGNFVLPTCRRHWDEGEDVPADLCHTKTKNFAEAKIIRTRGHAEASKKVEKPPLPL